LSEPVSTPSWLVVVGSSTGGPGALRHMLEGMPPLDATIVIVQHMPAYINQSLCRSLDNLTPMEVRLARDGDVLGTGEVLIAPSDLHLTFERNRIVRLVPGPKVHFVRPSVDVAMESLIAARRPRLAAVVLTGMGQDGAAGIRHVKRLGGITLAQSKDDCSVYGMPRAAHETGDVDLALPAARIGAHLARRVPRIRRARVSLLSAR
jgi:two-component system chemotaxis response regulator CheB